VNTASIARLRHSPNDGGSTHH